MAQKASGCPGLVQIVFVFQWHVSLYPGSQSCKSLIYIVGGYDQWKNNQSGKWANVAISRREARVDNHNPLIGLKINFGLYVGRVDIRIYG